MCGRSEQRWYASPAYREILRLRADHIPGDLVVVDGCGPDHDSAAMAAALRAAAWGRKAADRDPVPS